jgi:hypothetical protein
MPIELNFKDTARLAINKLVLTGSVRQNFDYFLKLLHNIDWQDKTWLESKCIHVAIQSLLQNCTPEEFQIYVKDLQVSYAKAPTALLTAWNVIIQTCRIEMLKRNVSKCQLDTALSYSPYVRLSSNSLDDLMRLCIDSPDISTLRVLNTFNILCMLGYLPSRRVFLLIGNSLLRESRYMDIFPLFVQLEQSGAGMNEECFELLLKTLLRQPLDGHIASTRLNSVELWIQKSQVGWSEEMISLLIRMLLKLREWESLSIRLQYLRNQNYKLLPSDYLNIILAGKDSKDLAEFCIKELYWVMQREAVLINSSHLTGLLQCCVTCRDFVTFSEIYPSVKSEDCADVLKDVLKITDSLPEFKQALLLEGDETRLGLGLA